MPRYLISFDDGSMDHQRFVSAGYSKAQALEVVLGVAVSILPSFAHHITECQSMAPSARMPGRRPTPIRGRRCPRKLRRSPRGNRRGQGTRQGVSGAARGCPAG